MKRIYLAPLFFVGWFASSWANSRWGLVGGATLMAVMLGIGVVASIVFNARNLRRQTPDPNDA